MAERSLPERPLASHSPPARWDRPSPLAFALIVACAAFLLVSFHQVELSAERLADGVPGVLRLLERMLPPATSRLGPILETLLLTFQMAVVGTFLGLLLSLPLAVPASRNLTPHPLVYQAARSLIAFFRTVPDLIWALIFVVAVGLGPSAGTLAIMIDTVGFAGRFFAEAMEESDAGPRDALEAIGAGRLGVIASAVIPDALPSLVATSLFSLEKATRSSVVLGLVGAGGIGLELKAAMDLFQYAQASTIIIAIFLLVLAVEQASGLLRRRIL